MTSWKEIRDTLGRNELPARLIYAWEWDEFDSLEELAIGIEDAWTSAEFPEQAARRRDWLAMFSEVGYLEEAVRAAAPLEPVQLYRGAIRHRRRGMSWTRDFERALWFSRRFGDDAHLWQTVAPPQAVLAHFHDSRREDEFVLDARGLQITAFTK